MLRGTVPARLPQPFNERSEESELVVMRADGAGKKQITDTPRSLEYDADWQPLPRETATPD